MDENSLLLSHQVGDDVAHECKLLGRKPPIGGRSGDACCLLIPKARDAHLKELVEVAGEDGEESNLLEQRHLGVARELEDPGVEGEPTQLPVEDVGVVVIPAPTWATTSAPRTDGVGHARPSTNNAAPIAPPASPRRAGTTERRCRRTLARQPRPRPAAGTAHQDARRNLHRARRVRCQDGDDGRHGEPRRCGLVDEATSERVVHLDRRGPGFRLEAAVGSQRSIASLSGAPAAMTRRSSALRPA